MKRTQRFLLMLMFVATVFLSLHGVASAVSVAYLYGNTDYQESVYDYLNGHFDSVALINGNAETLPTLAELSVYDAILVSTNWVWSYTNRSEELGNLLADYVNAGGKLVLTTFSWQYQEKNGLSGRLLSGGYSPFTGGFNLYSYATLGNYTVHPIMAGVNDIKGLYRDAVTASDDAQVIAYWSDGTPFVAIDEGSGVVGVNVFPEDSAGYISGDYAQLFINALNWVAANKTTRSKYGTGWLLTVDGMEVGATFFPYWPDMPTIYLYEAISPDEKKNIMRDLGLIYAFAWSRDIYQTSDAVDQLYNKIKDLNKAGGPGVILSHSWGTVLAYLALAKHDDIYVDKLITLGSPLESNYPPFYYFTDSQLQENEVYSVSKLDNIREWHNYYAFCDLISGQISLLGNNDNIKNKKIYLTTSACHSSYFDDSKQWDKILNDVGRK